MYFALFQYWCPSKHDFLFRQIQGHFPMTNHSRILSDHQIKRGATSAKHFVTNFNRLRIWVLKNKDDRETEHTGAKLCIDLRAVHKNRGGLWRKNDIVFFMYVHRTSLLWRGKKVIGGDFVKRFLWKAWESAAHRKSGTGSAFLSKNISSPLHSRSDYRPLAPSEEENKRRSSLKD